MKRKPDTSPTVSEHNFALGVEIGRIRSQLDLIMHSLMVLLHLHRSHPSLTTSTTSARSQSPPSTATGAATPSPAGLMGTLHSLMERLSTEAFLHLLELAGRFLLRKVLPAAIASALAAASGLGSMIASWLGTVSKLVLGW